jgi:hypothetical protein
MRKWIAIGPPAASGEWKSNQGTKATLMKNCKKDDYIVEGISLLIIGCISLADIHHQFFVARAFKDNPATLVTPIVQRPILGYLVDTNR